MSVQIKICGVKTPEAVDACVDAGATHIGLNLYPPSSRYVSPQQARELRDYCDGRIKTVMLLVNEGPEETARAIEAVKPDVVQFHGRETPEWCGLVRERTGLEVWKAVGMQDAGSLMRSEKFLGKVDRLLFDAPAKEMPGGTGETFSWGLLKGHQHRIDWALAGGLTPENVADAIRQTGAPLVDTSSGVEVEPGSKDVDLIARFCKAALEA